MKNLFTASMNFFNNERKRIDNHTKKNWAISIMEKYSLSLSELKTMVSDNEEMSEKTNKIYHSIFQSQFLTLKAIALFLFVSYATHPRLGFLGILLGLLFSFYWLYANHSIKKNSIRKHVMQNEGRN